MVALTASGQIFSLRAEGGVAADEWVSASGETRLRGDVLAELTLCHGLSAGLGARVAAEAEGRLGALWVIAASGDADASAQAQAFARALFSGNVFEDFGAALQAGAEVTASASAQAGIGLDAGGVAALAAELLDGLALDLFLAFLNEVRAEGGAKATASVGAAALAEAGIAGNLLEDPARFEIALGASAAAGAGAGVRAFVRCELGDPKRLAANSAELIAAEIAAAAREHLPESAHGLVEYVELLVPVAFGVAWEVGEITTLEALGPPEAFADGLIAVVAGRLQRWVLDRGVDLGLDAAAAVLADLPQVAALDGLDQAARDALADQLDAIADGLPAQPIPLARLGEVAADILAAVADTFGGDVARGLRRPLTTAWTAAAAVIAIRDATTRPGAEAVVVGAAPVSTAAADLVIPAPPSFVRLEWAALGHAIGREATFAECVDVLIAVGLGDELTRVPHLGPLLRDLSERLDLTPGDLVHAALTAGIGGSLARTEVYERVRDLVAEGIDGAIATELLPRLRDALPSGHEAVRWIDEAAAPSLFALRGFALDRLDALVAGNLTGDLSPFLNRLRTLLGVLAGKLVLRNVEVLAEILTDHVLDTLPDELRRVADEIEAGAGRPVVDDWAGVASSLVAGASLLADAETVERATRELLAGLMRTAADTVGVYTPGRRRRLYALQRRAWRVNDLAVNYADLDEVADFVENILDCSFLPDEQAVVELAELDVTLLGEQLGLTLARLRPLLETFFGTVLGPAARELQQGFGRAIHFLDERLEDVRQLLEDLDAVISEALADVEVALREVGDFLEAAEGALASQETRDLVREEIRAAGRAHAFDVGGDALAVTFDVAWAAFGWVVDPALAVLGAVAGALADVVEDAADATVWIAAVEDELAREAQDALAGIDLLDLAEFLGVADIVAAVTGAARQPTVQGPLASAAAAEGRRVEAQGRVDRGEADRDVERGRRRRLVLQRAGINTRAVRPRILNPAPLWGDLRRAFAHAGLVELRVALPGGDARLLDPAAPRRLAVWLNGGPVRLAPGSLVAGPGGAELRRALTAADGLRPGVNVVECAVAQLGRPIARESVGFVWHPRTGADPGLRIDLDRSRLNAVGDDHRAVREERVVLVNAGRDPVALAGWRVADRAGHSYRFDGEALAPGRRVELRTGAGTDGRERRWWGRKRAVWNNPGDSVYLVGADGLVRDVAIVGRSEEARRG